MRTLIFIIKSDYVSHALLCGTMAEISSMLGQCGHKWEGDDEQGHSNIDSNTHDLPDLFTKVSPSSNSVKECILTSHRLTYPKGVHLFRYFPYINSFVMLLMHICILPENCNLALNAYTRSIHIECLVAIPRQHEKHVCADNKRIWQNEYMHENF